MNLPVEANLALVDFMSATRRYSRLVDALAVLELGDEHDHPARLELAATVRDAEQAIIALFTAILGDPDVRMPE